VYDAFFLIVTVNNKKAVKSKHMVYDSEK